MSCRNARNLFGAYWDDEITQAEREWLEGHFASCEGCRAAYEDFSRPLEVLASLPRIDAEPGFADRVLARVRRASPAADRLPSRAPAWVPMTAAAALLLVTGTLLGPWFMTLAGRSQGTGIALRPPGAVQTTEHPREAVPVSPQAPVAHAQIPADSLFDHREDVEFVLDPVTLRKGQATLSRQAPATQGERVVVSF